MININFSYEYDKRKFKNGNFKKEIINNYG